MGRDAFRLIGVISGSALTPAVSVETACAQLSVETR